MESLEVRGPLAMESSIRFPRRSIYGRSVLDVIPSVPEIPQKKDRYPAWRYVERDEINSLVSDADFAAPAVETVVQRPPESDLSTGTIYFMTVALLVCKVTNSALHCRVAPVT